MAKSKAQTVCLLRCGILLVFLEISMRMNTRGAKDLVYFQTCDFERASLQMTVQLCRNGLSDWAGSDTMQMFEAGLAVNLCTVMLWAGTSTMHI